MAKKKTTGDSSYKSMFDIMVNYKSKHWTEEFSLWCKCGVELLLSKYSPVVECGHCGKRYFLSGVEEVEVFELVKTTAKLVKKTP